MQYKSLAVALFTSLPLLAAAQSSVTVYGVVDAAVSSEDTGAAGVGRQTVINSGDQSSSRIGFRGTEDLGNGLKAIFNIEAGVNLDTGAASDTNLFSRRAVVGLQNEFGTLTVGREYTPLAAVASATDILGQGFYGSNLSAFSTSNTASPLTRRISNSVNFKSASFSGFKVNAGYGAGETPTGASLDLKGVSLEYANGPFYAGGGYQVTERIAGDFKEYALGLGYKIGDVEIKGNYLAADPDLANDKFEQLNVGAAMKVGAAGKVFANVQQNKLQNGAKGNGFTLAYSYTLSKRTNLYASYASLRNNDVGVFSINASSTNVKPAALGADPDALTIGLRHSF